MSCRKEDASSWYIYVVLINSYKSSFNYAVSNLHSLRIPLTPMWIWFLPISWQEPHIVMPHAPTTTLRLCQPRVLQIVRVRYSWNPRPVPLITLAFFENGFSKVGNKIEKIMWKIERKKLRGSISPFFIGS
jgi:hypothetical protein